MIPAVTDGGVEAVREHGGAQAIAISHPHYYSAASAWSAALGDLPVLLHAADAEWVTRPFDAIDHWQGNERELPGGLTLLRLGGHFPGATVLHWPAGADGRGVLLSGDVVMALPDRNVSFMWSFPNLVPLPASEIERIGRALEPWAFDRIYGAWWDRVVPSGAKAAVGRSVERYARALRGELPL
jgi:glyoxylase-like metal-dependent hydrolase (beta-lactamase superfamily II)